MDELGVEAGAGWIERRHPDYHLTFTQAARGQSLRVHVDYHADVGFLGLFIYWPARFEAESLQRLCLIANRVNWDAYYGCVEIEPNEGVLRFRASLDARGIHLTPAFLDRMLESGLWVIDRHATELLTGPTRIVK